jgi:hypothetical protein
MRQRSDDQGLLDHIGNQIEHRTSGSQYLPDDLIIAAVDASSSSGPGWATLGTVAGETSSPGGKAWRHEMIHQMRPFAPPARRMKI